MFNRPCDSTYSRKGPHMKVIAIRLENAQKVEDALRAVNGDAIAHTYTSASELIELAKQGEARLDELNLPGRHRAGAALVCTSGEQVANAYKWARVGTRVTLRRMSRDWGLELVEPAKVYTRGGGHVLTLTSAQDEHVVKRVRATYTIHGSSRQEADEPGGDLAPTLPCSLPIRNSSRG